MTIPEDEKKLDTCGCCEGTTPQERHYNRPGQPAISYRLGTHSTILSRMKERLSKKSIPDGKNNDSKPLTKLTTRSTDDPSIAILDAWAMVSDVLTFYQERIANEGFLRTATERRSVLEMARAIGYELKPGVAAGTYLAFTLEDAKGAPGVATIDEGIRVLSIPGQNEKPQVFETIEMIEGRVEWNALKPRMTEPLEPGLDAKEVYLSGVDTGLKPGDGLLFVGDERELDLSSERWDFRRVQTVTTDRVAGYTKVTWDEGLGWKFGNRTILPPQKNLKIYSFSQQAALFGYNAPDFRAMADSVKRAYLNLASNAEIPDDKNKEWSDYSIASLGKRDGLFAEYFDGIEFNDPKERRIDSKIDFDWKSGPPYLDINTGSFSVRWTGFIVPDISGNYDFEIESKGGVRFWIKGKLVIDNLELPLQNKKTIKLKKDHVYDITLEYIYTSKIFYKTRSIITEKPMVKLYWKNPGQRNREIIPKSELHPSDIYLDAVYKKILPDSWLVLTIPEYMEVYQAGAVVEDSQSNFTISSKTTRVTLKGENLNLFNDKLRETVVFARSQLLEMAEVPISTDISGDSITLDCKDCKIDKLSEGQLMVVSGKNADGDDISEIVTFSGTCLFSWEKIPGNDNVILREFLVQKFNVEWVEAAEIKKNDDVKTIEVSNESKYILLTLNYENTNVNLKIDDGRTDKFIVKTENGELNIYSETDDIGTKIVFSPALSNTYQRDTVTINANVARATHGETVSEVLGSGNAGESYQKFLLKKAPLTYVSAPTPGGALSTLEIHVDGVQCQEAPSFFNLDSDNRSYIVRIDDDSNAHITFGDGKKGARLPTGIENITATYRNGIGPEGEVSAGSLTLLQSRPPGVRSVTNPLAASGAESPEQLSDARRNAPVTVQTLDRIVSLQDFENLARSFAGIGKAKAQALHVGQNRLVHITVATASGLVVDPKSKTYEDLYNSIDSFRDPIESVQVDGFQLKKFSIDALLIIDKRYFADDVKSKVESSLIDAFSFYNRDFGQPVSAAEVFSVMQSVEGVIALNELKLNNVKSDSVSILYSKKARAEKDKILQAELLLIDPKGLKLRCIQNE